MGAAMTFRGRLILCLFAVLLVRSATAQDAKSLHWPTFEVSATLDADGRLHVIERQEILFNGDWNGGYRRFRLLGAQELDLHRVLRVDAQSGREIELVEGDVDQVDHYEQEGDTVRWRSRLQSDPPFVQQRITYVLDYMLSRILISEEDGTFTIDHDFTFPDRDAVMERVRVDLTLDEQWQPVGELPATFTRDNLAPGDSLVVTAQLRHLGASAPAGVWMPPSLAFRRMLLALVLSVLAVLSAIFIYREAQLGRFSPLTPVRDIDAAWLQANLLRFLPEEAGAVWDESIGAPEVAAIMTRLVEEGKLESEVKEERFLFIPLRTLKLRLTPAGKTGKRSYEATLIQKLFVKGGDETDTDKIREHYKRTGFNPAAEIRQGLEKAMRRHPELKDTRKSPSMRPLIVAFVVCAIVACFGLSPQSDPVGAFVVVLTLSVGAAAFSAGGAARWRAAINHPIAYAPVFLVPALVPTVVLATVSFSDAMLPLLRPDFYLLLGLAGLAVTTFLNALRCATSKDGPQRLAVRTRLASARRFLAHELSQPEPRLRDEWYPYVVAFGLGSAATRWFRRFGGASTSVARTSSGSWTSGSSTSTGTSTGSWSGGGGKFGGAGAGGAWVAAVGTVASGVSRPSSSKSGGGGGGSSGGGGGGGW